MQRSLLGAAALAALAIGLVPSVAGATTPPTEPPAPTTTAATTTTVARDAGVEVISTGDQADTIDVWAPGTPPAPGTVLRTTETYAFIGEATVGENSGPFTITHEAVETVTVTASDETATTGTYVVESFDRTTDTFIAEALADDDPRLLLIGVPITATRTVDGTFTAEFAPEVTPTPEQADALRRLIEEESGNDVPLPTVPLGDGAQWVSPLDYGGPEPVDLSFELVLDAEEATFAGTTATDAGNIATGTTSAPAAGPVVAAYVVTVSRTAPAGHVVVTLQFDGRIGTAEEGFDLVGTAAVSSTTDVITPDGATVSVAPPETTVAGG